MLLYFLIESALKWLRQRSYPFLDASWSLQGLRIKNKETEEGRGRGRVGDKKGKRHRDGGGEGVTETNAPALTAVLHFLTDRCKIEDQKSNESRED